MSRSVMTEDRTPTSSKCNRWWWIRGKCRQECRVSLHNTVIQLFRCSSSNNRCIKVANLVSLLRWWECHQVSRWCSSSRWARTCTWWIIRWETWQSIHNRWCCSNSSSKCMVWEVLSNMEDHHKIREIQWSEWEVNQVDLDPPKFPIRINSSKHHLNRNQLPKAQVSKWKLQHSIWLQENSFQWVKKLWQRNNSQN